MSSIAFHASTSCDDLRRQGVSMVTAQKQEAGRVGMLSNDCGAARSMRATRLNFRPSIFPPTSIHHPPPQVGKLCEYTRTRIHTHTTSAALALLCPLQQSSVRAAKAAVRRQRAACCCSFHQALRRNDADAQRWHAAVGSSCYCAPLRRCAIAEWALASSLAGCIGGGDRDGRRAGWGGTARRGHTLRCHPTKGYSCAVDMEESAEQ